MSSSGMGVYIILAVMAIVTLATRWGGVLIMSWVPINPKVSRFINAMSGSVLIAILTPMAVDGDWGARLAMATTFIMMLTLKKPLPAVVAGIAVAAISRQFL